MKLRLGLHLDGQHGRVPENQLGVADIGPMALLGLLENQLGLVASQSSASERVVQFRDCLEQVNSPQRFFHHSYAADDFGTAVTLLDWRDTWRLHGWTGEIPESAGPRLRDMVAVEACAIRLLSPGLAERLEAVVREMKLRPVKIESITLVDPLSAFPQLWQRVLAKLPALPAPLPTAGGNGLLGKLQATLVSGNHAHSTPIDWQEDGSVHVVRSETLVMGGRWLAEALHQADANTLYVATAAGATTDAFLSASNFPRQGLSDTSAFRPALQLLPLMLEMLWQPLNFNALIQFLTHPICPVPVRARRRLANVQSKYPGIGGPRWHEAIKAIEETAGERASAVRKAIAFWIEHPKHDPQTGAPVDAVLERATRLTEFFRNCPEDASLPQRQAYAAGFKQCKAFSDSVARLQQQGTGHLRPRQLDQLVSQVTARGADNPLRLAEVGARPCITHPGAVVAASPVVIWGPLSAPALPPPWPWSASELRDLRASCCALPDDAQRLQQAAAEWLRPVLAATDKLILLLPPADQETHPIVQQLSARLSALPIHPIEILLRATSQPMVPVVHAPLPQVKRWWKLPADTPLPVIKQHSFTQLEKLIFNPYHWLLSDAAHLNSGSLLSLPDDFRLKGVLAHSLVERLYQATGGLGMSEADFSAWFDPAFDQLIAEEGAVYLMPGRRTDLETLRQRLRRALHELRQILSNTAVERIEPERKLEGQFVGGALIGYSDLVVQGPLKDYAIIDMKWAGKNHLARLQENRHLQLAIYGELLRQHTGRWPTLAYFLISTGTLLTRSEDWFAGVSPVRSTSDENTAQLWERFLVTWKWRQAQFAEGLFEVAVNDCDEDAATPPEDGIVPLEVMNPNYNDCLTLAGWGAAS